MRNLSREALDHDDPNHKRHGRDKLAKAVRDAVAFVAIPSPLRGGGKELTGVDFDADSFGFMFEFGDSSANRAAALGDILLPRPQRVNPTIYKRRLLTEEKERRRFRRTITKNGKEVETWGKHKCGAVSMVVTVPPWSMAVINTLEDDVRDNLLMEGAHVAAEKMYEVSGRIPWGAGCHLDTDIPHFHFQIPKTSPAGDNWEKSKFKTGGPWLVGADRMDRKFPGLLSAKQKSIMDGHKQRKGQLVDLEVASSVDAYLEKRFREMGFEKEYEGACDEYVRRKKRTQETDRDRALLRESLRYFAVDGIWPLAAGAMRFCMWRMIPREHRTLVMESMRLTQVIAAPIAKTVFQIATKQILEKLSVLPEPVMRGPRLPMPKI